MMHSLRPDWNSSACSARGVSALLWLGLLLRPPAIYADEPQLGPALHEGLTYEHTLSPGEVYSFPVELREGEYLQASVDQFGVDPAVVLVDAQGKEAARFDCAAFDRVRSEREHFAALAPAAGAYSLQIQYGSTNGMPPEGRFVLRIEAKRTPTAGDLGRLRAFRLLQAGSESIGRQDYPAAARNFDDAGMLLRNPGDEHALAFSRLFAGHAKTKFGAGRWPGVEADFSAAAALLSRLEGLDLRIQLLFALVGSGQAEIETQRWTEARENLERALPLAKDLHEPAMQAQIGQFLGWALTYVGEFEKALEALDQGLLAAQEITDPEAQAEERCLLLSSVGSAYIDSGRFQKALRAYRSSLSLAIRFKFVRHEAAIRNNIALIYQILGEHQRAAGFLETALELDRVRGETERRARTLNNLANNQRFLGNYPQALATSERAIDLARKAGDNLAYATALTSMAYLQTHNLNQPAKGNEFARRALQAANGLPATEGPARHALAVGLRKLGKLEEARKELDRALALIRSVKNRALESEILLTLARVERDEGHLEAARDRAAEAVDVVEAMRPSVFSGSFRASLLAMRVAQYEVYIDSLMDLDRKFPDAGYMRRAFEVSEKLRARTLLERLSNLPARRAINRGAQNADRLREISTSIGELQLQRQEEISAFGPSSEQARELLDRLDEEIEEYEEAAGSDVGVGTGSAPRLPPAPLSLAEIQSQVVDPSTALLEVTLGAERSWLWMVSDDGIRAFQLPGKAVLERSARSYYELVTARNRHPAGETRAGQEARIAAADKGLVAVGRELSSLLLRPLETLPEGRTILLVTDGALQYIPFGALPLPGSEQPLITRFTPVVLTSASALAMMRREEEADVSARKTLALFAAPTYRRSAPSPPGSSVSQLRGPEGPSDLGQSPTGTRATPKSAGGLALPPLHWAEREAQEIARLVPEEQLFSALGSQASRATLEGTDLTLYRYLHFATHGIVDSERPALSSIVLSLFDDRGNPQDGYLRLVDIQNLRLHAELVTLSACRTALGREVRGEGLDGLARGFMEAGASRVVASLWSVDDRATAQLMAAFYRFLLTDHLAPSEALRRAQLETYQAMAKDPKRNSPYYWAAFTLQGEWR